VEKTTSRLFEARYHWTRGLARALSEVRRLGGGDLSDVLDDLICRVARESRVTLEDVKRSGAPRTDVVALRDAGLT
jgi:hypothetical protein